MSDPRPDDDRLRRLLADARHTEPMPPDVAARMDGVLADLGADRPVRATVTDLASVRRRRRVRTLLVAAAAVVVAGIGIDQVRDGIGSTSDSSADTSADTSADDAAGAPPQQPHPAEGVGGGGSLASEQPGRVGHPVRLDPDRFGRQVARLQHGGAASFSAQDHVDALQGVRCRAPGDGRAVAVTYDGEPGVLVFRPPSRDSQVVDLVLCGHAGVARSITLPAP
ncbi:MAG TPA: hypothetical protein VFT70_03825 [Nocardioides sp.]|nr:hypothetical protein [Nocardioides sp.]